MTPCYTQLQEALSKNGEIVLGTAVDTLGDLGGGIPALIAQKAFLCQGEIVAETPSMLPFWQGLFEGLPSEFPHSIEGETWRALMIRVDEQETAFPTEGLAHLAQGKGLILATVVHTAPDAPCKTGTKILIETDGTVYGSLGNAALQSQAVEMIPETMDLGMPRLLNTEDTSILLELVNL